MRILCISSSKFLNKGTWYNCKNIDSDEIIQFYYLENNNFRYDNDWYHSINFITESEYRNEQLEKIGI